MPARASGSVHHSSALTDSWGDGLCRLFISCPTVQQLRKIYFVLTTIFQVNIDQAVPPRFSSSTCSRQEPLRWVAQSFNRPDVLPITQQQYQNAEGNTKHWPQPVAWPRLWWFIRHETPNGKGIDCFSSPLIDNAAVTLWCHTEPPNDGQIKIATWTHLAIRLEI